LIQAPRNDRAGISPGGSAAMSRIGVTQMRREIGTGRRLPASRGDRKSTW
jgi:hypothetical protein